MIELSHPEVPTYIKPEFNEFELSLQNRIIASNPELFENGILEFYTKNTVLMTRFYGVTYSMELVQDLKCIRGLDAEEELYNIVEEGIVYSIKKENEYLNSLGFIPKWIKLINTIGMINSRTFQPEITLYGTYMVLPK